MASEQSSAESTPQKRQRRVKQDPQFVFEKTITDIAPPVPKKLKPQATPPTDDNTTGADLYEPGDIVWSKLGSFPWWPALIFRCDAEGGIHTRTLNSNNKSKRQFFVYFYGKYLEYAWLSTRSLLKYAGLNDFIQHAEAAVQQASTKSEQVELANRYQLKVSMKKRVQWDEAIELADHALTMTKDERIKEFKDLLSDVRNNKKHSKHGIRRRKTSVDKKDDEAIPNKRPARTSLSTSFSSEALGDPNTMEKPSHPLASLQTPNNMIPSRSEKIKRGRKSHTESKVNENNHRTTNSSTLHPTANHSIRTRVNQRTSSSNENKVLTRTSLSTRKIANKSEIKHEGSPISHTEHTSAPLMPANIPPLSNYEHRQIAEGLLHHPKGETLTFDEAQTFANDQAIDIVSENYHYRMDHISSEWFYDSILLKYPSLVFKYRQWFEQITPDVIPNETDVIQLKQWQIALMIQARILVEQQSSNDA